MNRKLLVIFIVLVVSAAVIFTVKYFDKKKNSTEDFNTVLMAVDQSLKENSNENTRSLLLKVKIESLNLRETKRLIKRVFKYSQINGNYSLLETKSKECIKEFPNDTEFKAIYVFSTIKNGKYETAYKYSKNNISDSKFYTLKEESILLGSDGNNTDKKMNYFLMKVFLMFLVQNLQIYIKMHRNLQGMMDLTLMQLLSRSGQGTC